jgi:hypothetical protein
MTRGTTGWSDNEISRELRRFLRGRKEWPSYREFQRAGLRTLRDQVSQQGGARYWAAEIGVRYVERRPGYAPIWTEDRIRRDLRRYLAGRNEWPSRRQFERDGKTALRNAVNRTGGPDRWAMDFGLPRTSRLSGIRRGWSPDAIEDALHELIGDGDVWPSRREFEKAGLYSMLTAIYRHEGPEYWAALMGVRKTAVPGNPKGSYWTSDRIREELEAFCAGRESWPPEREFVATGKRALYRAASRKGGVAYWSEQLGLPRRRCRR